MIRKNPVSYALCNQDITIYHRESGKIIRTVRKAFLDEKKVLSVERTGSSEANSFLCVVPCDHPVIAVGDKIYRGIGPESITWERFIPSLVPGVVVVKFADIKYWGNRIVHTEAGG